MKDMPRTLRSRASRPNYAAMLQSNEDGAEALAGPSGSQAISPANDEDSGSDFAPEAPKDDERNEDNENDGDKHSEDSLAEDADEVMADAQVSGGDESDFGGKVVGGSSASTLKRKRRTANQPNKRAFIPALSASRASRQSLQPLGTPNYNHRHRPVPIYTKEGPVERLTKPPVLFGRDEIAMTNSWGTPVVGKRVSKSWGYNVGPGPLWELLEDRGWFPEAIQGPEGETDASRRPKVHDDIPAGSYEILASSCVLNP